MGTWAEWAAWNKCNVSCGVGHRYRNRECPQNVCVKKDGSYGMGEMEWQACNKSLCICEFLFHYHIICLRILITLVFWTNLYIFVHIFAAMLILTLIVRDG